MRELITVLFFFSDFDFQLFIVSDGMLFSISEIKFYEIL